MAKFKIYTNYLSSFHVSYSASSGSNITYELSSVISHWGETLEDGKLIFIGWFLMLNFEFHLT